MIAYCLYKNQKKIYIENLANRYRTIGRRSQRVEVFHKDFFNDNHITDFRDAADLRLTTYIKKFTDEAKNEAYREIASHNIHDQIPDQKNDKSKKINKWIFSVSTSITATIIVGVFVDLDEYFPSIDPFPDAAEEQAELPPAFDADPFDVEPAAPPRQFNLPVM